MSRLVQREPVGNCLGQHPSIHSPPQALHEAPLLCDQRQPHPGIPSRARATRFRSTSFWTCLDSPTSRPWRQIKNCGIALQVPCSGIPKPACQTFHRDGAIEANSCKREISSKAAGKPDKTRARASTMQGCRLSIATHFPKPNRDAKRSRHSAKKRERPNRSPATENTNRSPQNKKRPEVSLWSPMIIVRTCSYCLSRTKA